jgi:DNA mismatch repair protein MutS
VLDCSVTAMGSRALRRWLNRPIRAQPELRARYHALAALAIARYEALRARLRDIGDLERILARVALRSARPRDLVQLRARLAAAPGLRSDVGRVRFAAAGGLQRQIGEHARARCCSARLRAEPSHAGARWRRHRAGYDAALDELRLISGNTDAFLLELERRERERSGIAGLKLGYNRVQGFYIEVSRRRPSACRPTTCAGRPSRAPSVSSRRAQGLRGQGARRARAGAGAREASCTSSC